jgi:mannosyltransferase OCH1-like enzyme
MMMTGISKSNASANDPHVRRRLMSTTHDSSNGGGQNHEVTPAHNQQHEHGEKIPKIIHQIYLGFDANRHDAPAIPDRFLKWREHCRFVNPEYKLRLWNKRSVEQLIQTKYQFLWDTWQGWSSEWIKQADAARYIVLNEYGGVYMDLDYSCEAPVDSMIANATVVLQRGQPGVEHIEYIDNSFMASVPHHWFWGNVLPVMVQKAHLSVLAATGPNMLHHVLYDVCGKTPEIQHDPLNRPYQDPDVGKYGIKLVTREMQNGIIHHHNSGSWLGLYNKTKPKRSD